MVDKKQNIPLKEKFRLFLIRIRDLQGEPRYVATGMAIGIFVAVTPTIPFHTILALALALILKGSKPAAVIGVWFSNPLTIAPLYYGSFKIGTLLLREPLPEDINFKSITELFELGLDVTLAMLIGGVLLGIIPAVIAYFVTFRVVVKLRKRARQKARESEAENQRTEPQKPENRDQGPGPQMSEDRDQSSAIIH